MQPWGAGSNCAAVRGSSMAEAHLIAMAISQPPEGRVSWTMQMLADGLVEREIVDSISPETVRRTLKKTNSSLG